jgi:uncharacterized protein YdeI (YjbR/CyaY-like superfamily)
LPEDYAQYHPKTLKAWRSWLEKNHASEKGIWLVYYKKETGKRAFSYDESVEEALCFGWIDSLPRILDAERSMLKFTVRKPKSVWSELNKKRIERLIKEKRMTPAGLQSIKIAKANGSWDTLSKTDEQARTGEIPEDLRTALSKNKTALEVFTGFPPSCRKQFLVWIDSAKREETRQSRIAQTVLMSAAKKKPGPQGFKL